LNYWEFPLLVFLGFKSSLMQFAPQFIQLCTYDTPFCTCVRGKLYSLYLPIRISVIFSSVLSCMKQVQIYKYKYFTIFVVTIFVVLLGVWRNRFSMYLNKQCRHFEHFMRYYNTDRGKMSLICEVFLFTICVLTSCKLAKILQEWDIFSGILGPNCRLMNLWS